MSEDTRSTEKLPEQLAAVKAALKDEPPNILVMCADRLWLHDGGAAERALNDKNARLARSYINGFGDDLKCAGASKKFLKIWNVLEDNVWYHG